MGEKRRERREESSEEDIEEIEIKGSEGEVMRKES